MAMFVKCCFIAEQAGVPVWHGSGVDLGIMDMSYVHACAAAPAATLPSDVVGNFLREDDLLVEPIRIEDGYAEIGRASCRERVEISGVGGYMRNNRPRM